MLMGKFARRAVAFAGVLASSPLPPYERGVLDEED